LSLTEDGWVLEDIGSKNGTFVSGRRVHKPVALRNRDTVRIGQTRMTLSADGEDPADTDTASVEHGLVDS
jgi:pSer/pThr/pTyr-binding forkhead associated (FHA) protein